MNRAYLLTGSNMGNREQNLAIAADLVNTYCGKVISRSSLYETAAWGKTDQDPFLNQAIEIETSLNARQLIRRILKTEKQMGRIRKEKYGPRLIDIDILLYNDEVHSYQFLVLPHPEMQHRRFALAPLAEIAPQEIHPVSGKTISQLLNECPDNLPVNKYG